MIIWTEYITIQYLIMFLLDNLKFLKAFSKFDKYNATVELFRNTLGVSKNEGRANGKRICGWINMASSL